MTNEQLTQEVIRLSEEQARAQAEHEKFEVILKELQEDVKTTKSLAEDVHILAINMETMQKTVDETNQKVDEMNSKEFAEYKKNKTTMKNSIINTIGGAIGIGLLVLIIWFLINFVDKGGV